jgi:cytochrome P450
MSISESDDPLQHFDHHSEEHAQDPVGDFRAIRERGGFLRSDSHGGFTTLARYEDVVSVAKNHGQFSNANELPGGDGFGGGVTLPHNPSAPRMSLAEMDPPEWHRIRRLLSSSLSNDAVKRFAPQILRVVNELIDRFIESGRCDLVFDICSPVPAIVTLEYLGLPTAEWERWAVPIHTSVYTSRVPGSPDFVKLNESFEWIFEQIREAIADRHRSPRPNDLITDFIRDDGDGPVMDDDLAFETVYTMLAAGVDTTTTLLSTTLFHLSENPHHRAELIENPSLLDTAADEFLRFYSPVQTTARTAIEDAEVSNETFHRGDRILLAWASANRDEHRFPEPDEFKLDRESNRHLSFGHGIHRCIGAPLARQEFIIVMSEILRRLPDFVVDQAQSPMYPDVGLMLGYQRMPATFTPGVVETRSNH